MAQPRPKGTAIVRQSKYRHLFGSHAQNTECVGSLKIGSLQVDSNIVKANEKFFSIPWMGNGCIAIIPLTQKGAINPELPLIEFEENIINDFNFHPFNNYLLVSASNDGIIAFWKIPEEGLTENIHIPIKTIKASEKRLLTVDFHNLASDVMLTIDSNKIIKLWDIEKCQDQITLPEIHKALLTNISWSPDGRLLATSCKDKILRIFDPRSNKCIEETSDHPGTKGSRVLWIAKKDFIFTCGFGKGSERQYALYDPRKLSQRLTLQPIDSSSSTLLPFVDNDNGIIFLAGKGDGNIRYYEVVDEDPYIYFLNEYKSKEPQSGIAQLPKQCCDVMKCEIAAFIKVTPQGTAIPLKFEVPRKDNMFFQEDLFPDTFDGKPSMTAEEWFSGLNNPPKFMSLDPEKRK